MAQPSARAVGIRQRIDAIAEKQGLVASRAELNEADVDDAAIGREVRAERLFVVYPGVYSKVRPELLSDEGRLTAAIRFGHEDARFAAQTLLHLAECLPSKPPLIHVATRHSRKPADGIRWHRLPAQPGHPASINGFPCTTLERAALDAAPDLTPRALKRVLAELEYLHGIDAAQVATALRRGHPGSARLRRAIAEHTPALAETVDELERCFAEFVVERGFEVPRFNHRTGFATVDVEFERARVIVELDGVRGHSGARRVLRDHRRDLYRRAEGKTVLRYAYAQITTDRDRDLVEADLLRAGVHKLANQVSPLSESDSADT